jgi:hypothetical protein
MELQDVDVAVVALDLEGFDEPSSAWELTMFQSPPARQSRRQCRRLVF